MCLSNSSKSRFCSPKCQHEWQRTRTGRDNPRYKRVLARCSYCNKEFYIQRYKIDNENKFCSKECRVEWYSNIWSKRSEWREESRERTIKMISNGQIPSTLTTPHKKVADLLSCMNIDYICEYPTKYYAIDIYIPVSNLMIEVMGDYWHSNPIKFNTPIYKTQKEAIRRDKAKRTYIKEYYGINILYLWESDINQENGLCKRLIMSYIKNNGLLDEYNSFNYHIEDDSLCLNDKLIVAHIDRPFELDAC